MTRTLTCGFAAIAVAAVSATSSAGIHYISSNGTGDLITAPSGMDYTADAYQDNPAVIHYWTEQINYMLTSDLVISMDNPGSYPTNVMSHYNDETHKVLAGTAIDSYAMYFDPRENLTIEAVFEFDAPILGLITNERTSWVDDHFHLSDYLAPGGATMPGAWFNARGIEPTGNTNGDFVRFITDRKIGIHWGAGTPGDQMRIITTPVPEPATIGTLAVGALALFRKRRRK